jgi:hypothetical protein
MGDLTIDAIAVLLGQQGVRLAGEDLEAVRRAWQAHLRVVAPLLAEDLRAYEPMTAPDLEGDD